MDNKSLIIKPLSRAKYSEALEATRQAVAKKSGEPSLDNFLRQSYSKYPKSLIIALVVGLVVISVAALWISAGKLLTVSDIVFGSLLNQSERTGELWLAITLLFVLALAEVGAFVFGVCAGILEENKRIFQAFMFGCAGLAIIANVEVMLNHMIPGYTLSQAWLTLLPPLVAIGVSFVLKTMLVDHLKQRADAIAKYNGAVTEWQVARNNPEMSAHWNEELYHSLKEAIRSSLPTKDRATFDMLCEEPDYEKEVVYSVWQAHNKQVDFLALSSGQPKLLTD